MDNSWSTSIEKLMLWRAGSWHKYDTKTTRWTLRLNFDVMLITADAKIFESFSLRSKIKGIYKGDILILIVSAVGPEVRKIKFQIKNNISECLEKIGLHFPVLNHNATTSGKVFESRYRNIDDVMKNAVQALGKTGTSPLPPDLNSFVKLCLLDPNMPQIIIDTQKILEDLK